MSTYPQKTIHFIPSSLPVEKCRRLIKTTNRISVRTIMKQARLNSCEKNQKEA